MGLIKNACIIVTLSYIARIVYIVVVDNGIGVHFNNHSPGKCRLIPPIDCGSEKVSVTSDGLAFITSSVVKCYPSSKGRIYLFDFNNPHNNVTELKLTNVSFNLNSFIPHGMDIFEDAELGLVKVYVVNHGATGDRIEVFNYDRKVAGELQHIKSITNNGNFILLNDISVVDEERFYVSNFMAYPSVFTLLIQYLIGRNTGNILYYDNGEITIADVGFFFNGITMSEDKSKLFTCTFGNGYVLLYHRNQQDGHLSLKSKIHVGYHPDNIYLDKQSGVFYVGYIKNLFTHAMFLKQMTRYSMSSGLKIIPGNNSQKFYVEEIFHNNGEFLNDVSSIVHYKGQYLLGTVSDRLGYCIE